MRHFTGRESRYCASTVDGCSVGFTPSKGSESTGLLRQWPLLLLAFLLVTLISEPAGAGPVKLNTALPVGGGVSLSGRQFSPDGSRVLYRAEQETDEVYELYSRVVKQVWNVASGQWDQVANWDQGEVPDEVMSIHVNPVSFATVSGPTLDTNIFSLDIGAMDTGIATLALQPSVTLTVLHQTAISSRGALAGSGHFDSRGGLVNDGDIGLDGMTIAAPTIENNGMISGGGVISAPLMNSSSGEVRVAAGQQMHFKGGSSINAGEINNFGGQMEFTQDLTNEADGFIGGRDTFFRFGSGLANAGEVGLSVGLHDILGPITNRAAGRIMVAGQSTATFYGDVENNGDLFTGQGSQSVFLGDVTGSGDFPGAGIVEFAGAVSPGNSPGTVTFGGDVVLGTTSTTQIELGETSDQLLVDGNASIDGELNVELLGDFTPGLVTSSLSSQLARVMASSMPLTGYRLQQI